MGLSTEEEIFDMQQDERGSYIVTDKSPFRQYMDSMSTKERLAEEQKIKTEKEHRREEKIIQSNFVDDDSFYTNGK